MVCLLYMRIAVLTCEKYADAWPAFTALFRKFWPDCPYPMAFHSDRPGESWCSVLARCAKESDEAVIVMQEDMFLNAPVRQELIEYALEQMGIHGAGCVRLYPCPGSNQDYGDPYFGIVKKGTKYLISCQASIFRADYLYTIASQCDDHGEASSFEIQGSWIANGLPDTVLAFNRDVKPWPIVYIASAISRGLWNPDAIRLCEANGIPLDLSMRGVAA